ncbi:MAG: hypothetical protein H6636_13470 [Anaerolineales bacterium]|nr:hypothetical protein [Anaerolineales bacterium]
MPQKHRIRMTFLSILATVIIFACQVGSAPTPTPAPTNTPIPTNTAVPTNTPEPTAVPTETPAEAPTEAVNEPTGDIISIDQVHGYYDIYDTLNVAGLVTNNTSRSVDNLEIEVEIFDANNTSLYKDTVYADLYSLAPGETSPFSLYVFDDLPDADNFVATVVGNSVTDLERATVDVSNSLMTFDDDGSVHLTGELINNTDQPILINSLAGAVFNTNSELVLAESYNVMVRYLDPGDTGPFRITITGPRAGTADLANFQLYFDAEVTDPIDPFNVTVSDAVNYIDDFDSLHLVGQVTNNGNQVLNIYLVAGLYDEAGNVIDAASLTVPFSALKPGEFSPYDFDYWGLVDNTAGMLDAAKEYTVQVDGWWTYETSTETIEMTTANDDNNFDSFGGTFTGQVVNNTGGPIGSATVVVYLVSKETGAIVATADTYLYEEIADGASLEYTVYLYPEKGLDVNSVEYYIIVKGQRP